VLVQIRFPKKRTAGGLYVPEETRETELWNTQVAKVITLGPVAFSNRDTLEPWPEGNWCQPGTYVRIPKYGGDRWQVTLPGTNHEFALFVLFKDHDIIGEVPEEYVLEMVAFL
jgi:co-chaperonin GroES (HSP10)